MDLLFGKKLYNTSDEQKSKSTWSTSNSNDEVKVKNECDGCAWNRRKGYSISVCPSKLFQFVNQEKKHFH